MSSRIRCLPRNDTGSKIYAYLVPIYLVPISSINLKSSLSESQGKHIRIVAEGICVGTINCIVILQPLSILALQNDIHFPQPEQV